MEVFVLTVSHKTDHDFCDFVVGVYSTMKEAEGQGVLSIGEFSCPVLGGIVKSNMYRIENFNLNSQES